MTKEQAEIFERRANVITDSEKELMKVGGSREDTYGWQPLPDEWVEELQEQEDKVKVEVYGKLKVPKIRFKVKSEEEILHSLYLESYELVSPGIFRKLGCPSFYGKMFRSCGGPPDENFIWSIVWLEDLEFQKEDP